MPLDIQVQLSRERSVIVKRIAWLICARSKASDLAVLVGGTRGWQIVTRPGGFVPHCLRKRVEDGWLYRDPTEAEVADFLANEAW